MTEVPQISISQNIPFLSWTKDAFSLNYSIFGNGQLVGKITDKSTDRSSKASLYNEKFIFETEGFIKTYINIYHVNNKTEIGRIEFELIRSRAKINLFEEQYLWKFSNLLQTKWILQNPDHETIISGEKRKEGSFKNQSNVNPILLLCALISRNWFIKQGN